MQILIYYFIHSLKSYLKVDQRLKKFDSFLNFRYQLNSPSIEKMPN